LMKESAPFRRIPAAAYALGVCLAAFAFPGCSLDEPEAVHLGIHLGNCNDSLFHTVCLAKEVSDDGRPIAHLPETFRVTLSGKIKSRGRDTTVSELPIAAVFGTGSETRIALPDSLAKSDPPLELRACVKDRADSLICAALSHDRM
jgi:hypothetical protein